MSNNFIDPTERLLDPKDDIVFKFLLTAKNEYSGKTLKSLISAFTGRKVTEVKIAENEPQGGNINEKHIRLDVNCVFDENKLASKKIAKTMGLSTRECPMNVFIKNQNIKN